MTMSPREPRAQSRAESEWFWFLSTRMAVRAAAGDTDGAYGLIEQTLPPGFAAPPHVHHGEDEQFYVIEGRVTFHCGGHALTAEPGAFVQLPRDVPHWFRVEGVEPARLLQVTTPGGVEAFFVAAGDASPDAPPDVARLGALAQQHHIELLGPPESDGLR